MKNTGKVLGIAAIIAAICFMILPLTGCGGGNDLQDIEKTAMKYRIMGKHRTDKRRETEADSALIMRFPEIPLRSN